MPALPLQNLSLGNSPETSMQWWEQFQFQNIPNGVANMGMATDCAVVFTLSTAQLLALQTTAVQLVAPPTTTGLGNLIPPGGYLYVPTTLTVNYDFEGTAFTIANADNAFQIEYTGKATSLISMLVTGLVDQVADTISTNYAAATGTKISTANSANLCLEVKLIGTTPALTLGNGNVTLNMVYNVVALL
jgi:hypothetical protein